MKAEKKELGTGRVAFLARLEEIKQGIEAGRTVMSVYREFGKKVGIGYSQFDRYVNKFIRSKPAEKQVEKQAAPGSNKSKPKDGFTFDPKPNKDLL